MDMTIGGLTLDSSDICIECNNIIQVKSNPCSDADPIQATYKEVFGGIISEAVGFEAGGRRTALVMQGTSLLLRSDL